MGLLDFVGDMVGAAAPYASTVLGMSGPEGMAINAGLQALGGYMSSSGQSDQQYKYQLALQHDSQAWQEKMWNMNNEYNSPANQVKRLQEGGLNANLAYGSLSGNVAQPATGAGTNSMGNYQKSTEIEAARTAMAVQMQNLMADLEVKKAEANLKNEQARTEQERQNNLRGDTELKGYQSDVTRMDYMYLFRTFSSRVQQIAFHNGLTEAQTKEAIQRTVASKVAVAIQQNMFELKKKYTMAQIMDIQSQINYRATSLVLQGELQQAQITHWASQNLLFNSQRILNFANADLSDSQYNLNNQQWSFNQRNMPYVWEKNRNDSKRSGWTWFLPKGVSLGKGPYQLGLQF